MKLSITSTVVLEIRDEGRPVEAVVQDLLASNKFAIDRPWTTVSGVDYTLRAVDFDRVELLER